MTILLRFINSLIYYTCIWERYLNRPILANHWEHLCLIDIKCSRVLFYFKEPGYYEGSYTVLMEVTKLYITLHFCLK